MALFVLCAIEGKHRSLHARGTDPVVSYASVAYSHTLFVLCAIEVLTVNTGTLPVPPFARVLLSDPFAILSLVSGPLPSWNGHLVAVLASQPPAHSLRLAAPAPPRRCRSTVRCTRAPSRRAHPCVVAALVRGTAPNTQGTSSSAAPSWSLPHAPLHPHRRSSSQLLQHRSLPRALTPPKAPRSTLCTRSGTAPDCTNPLPPLRSTSTLLTSVALAAP